MFRRSRIWREPFFPPPRMPFGPHMVKEMSQLVFLWTIAEEKEGVTGYDLQKNYDAKQTTVYRILKEMEEKGFLKSEETIESGRAQKLYFITEQGLEHLKGLREKWTTRIAFLSDIAPPEHFMQHPEHRIPPHRRKQYLQDFESKEEAIAFLEEMKESYKRRKARLEKRIERLEDYKRKADEQIKDLKQKESFDAKDFSKKIREEMRK